MKEITRITTQKKRKDRYNIYISDGDEESYGFSVDEAILVEYHLRKGLELEQSLMEELIEKDNLEKTYGLAINFLSYRMRTIKEMKDYLIKKEVNPEHIPIVTERLIKAKLLDDKLFSEMFVRTRMNTSSKGPLLIKKELIEKGVAATIAEEAISEYPYEIQFEKVLHWAEKKVKTTKKESFQNQIQKLQITLLQKGFSQAVISGALSEIHEEKDDDAEWDALTYQGDKLLRKHSAKHEGYALKNKIKEGLYRKGFSIEVINRYLDERLER
ncbi:recombination regulator RecX [Oceanobacillus bengalensis]|uniref:Regulatory protein RecX n=1 Tax=Oceanobacillus bengalensis TaxID=1435466 RepID=A0A494YWF4_9BACI|nr:recombination regulator RecX [Oceanobacillus bengalensis]RKQ14362.1 recombination regulator RecX [Oceanobacillus bengalensis]